MPAQSVLAWYQAAKSQLARIIFEPTQLRAELGLLLEAVTGLGVEILFTNPDHVLSDTQIEQLHRLVTQRCNTRQPVQYLLGVAYFYGLSFWVTPAVLIPRPETELLVEAVLSHVHAYNHKRLITVLDIGTGSGAIACAIKHRLQDTISVTASDISCEALQVAQENANRLGCEIDFCLGDGVAVVAPQHRFDIVVSNPPYIPEADWETLSAEVRQEPKLALISGSDGLNMIRQLLDSLPAILSSSGHVWLELGKGQFDIVQKYALQTGWEVFPPIKDYNGIERFIHICRTQRKA